jgi:hypothetical protein
MSYKRTLVGAAIAATLACGNAWAGNMLVNPGFNTPSGLGPTSFTNVLFGGESSTTALVPSTDPSGGGSAEQVTSTGPEDGIYQFVAPNSVEIVSVDVYVLSGSFELGLGQQGQYESVARTSVLDQWVHLAAEFPVPAAPGSPFPNEIGNEIFLYSTNGAGADFIVDNAFAGTVAEPASWPMLALGVVGAAVAARRRLWFG